ncbi:MAG: translation initiation factor IF-2 [bacterium]
MNISTLAKILGVTVNDLRETGQKGGIYGFTGRNTRIPYNSALDITKILRPERLSKLQNDDKIYLPSTIKVVDLAENIGKSSGLVIKTLLMNGVMVTLNEKIDYDTASLIAEELGVSVFPENPEQFGVQESDTQMVKVLEYGTKPKELQKFITRPPVVTIMGHVDHGKTTLLDYIRKSNVVASEAGAITQHISSYKINFKGKQITFVDTPGHEAFTAMRARGSQLADFIILVVSAVEGPKPQTIEVIERAKLSKSPVIVALNKIDLPGSDVEKVKTDISKFGLIPEEWGGETPFIPISAKSGQAVDKLLETILLYSEMADLKGEVDCPGQGLVTESNLDKNMGTVASVLIVKDRIKEGDIIRCGTVIGRVRKLLDPEGKHIKEAHLGDPVTIVGLPQPVEIGEPVLVYYSVKEATKDAEIAKLQKSRKQSYFFNSGSSKDKEINLVLKADVTGSLEALKESLVKIPQEAAKIVIKSESVGQVVESDVEFAHTTGSTILAFHTEISANAKTLIKKIEVNVFKSDIIYEILEWVESEIFKHIVHTTRIDVLGRATVLGVFKSEKPSIQVFGGEVTYGKILDNKPLRVVRDGEEIGRAEIVELQKNKSKVTEINISQQFGVSATNTKVKIKIGDIIETIDEVVIS